MSKIQQIPKNEKENIYKDILKQLKPLSEKYDLSTIRWALNKFVVDQREINKALKQKKEAEKRLKELGVN